MVYSLIFLIAGKEECRTVLNRLDELFNNLDGQIIEPLTQADITESMRVAAKDLTPNDGEEQLAYPSGSAIKVNGCFLWRKPMNFTPFRKWLSLSLYMGTYIVYSMIAFLVLLFMTFTFVCLCQSLMYAIRDDERQYFLFQFCQVLVDMWNDPELLYAIFKDICCYLINFTT